MIDQMNWRRRVKTGPKKIYDEVLPIPITKELKEALRKQAGIRGMAEYVRMLIINALKTKKQG